MSKFLICLLALSLATSLFAAEAKDDLSSVNPSKKSPEATELSKENKPWSLTGGLDIQSKYFFRGYLTTSKGFIAQPYAQLSYNIYDNNGLTIAPYIGTWNNVGSVGTGRSLSYWNESDVNAGIQSTFKDFTLTFAYGLYNYPNKSASQTQELGVVLAYDDSSLWKGKSLTLNPHVAYYHDVQNLATKLQDYIEAGVEPTFAEVKLGAYPVTFSVPVTVGMSSNGYYANSSGSNSTVGFFQAGLKAAVPLDFVKFGAWTLVGEVDYVRLSASSTRAADGGKNNDWTARLGLQFKF